MSGFIGVLSSPLQKTDNELLNISTAAITSCCNDYVGVWNSTQIDLRFGWLKTSEDTEEEQLPFTIDGNLRIVGDIRLDKRMELVKELGLYFKYISNSTPDSYLMLYAFKHWGEDCLQHVSGDFAFAIWNEQTSYLFCARDHFGLIPFYYTQYESRFLFTNFYSTLKELPNLMSELDDNVLRDYLTTGVNRSFDQTIYKKIKKLPPAHKLTYKDGEILISCYWEIPSYIKPIRYKTTKEYVRHFYGLFEQSIKDRTRTNKVGSSLSGGMDSSSITAITKKVLDDLYGNNTTLISYNILYRDLVSENEGYFGGLTAKHLKIPIKQYVAEDYLKNITQPLTRWLPEPVGIPNATAESQILSDVQTFSRVYLMGFGGDPLFGYDPLIRRSLKAQGYLFQPYLDDLLFYRVFGRFSNGSIRQKVMKLIKKAPNSENAMPSWNDNSFFAPYSRSTNQNKDGTSIRSYFAMSANPYWSWLFETSHPGFTGNKIKVRQPFFSLDLLLYMLSLPPHLLYNKSMLRMAMFPFLPEAVVKRQKTILFGDPYSQNFKKKEILDIFKKKVLESDDFLAGKINIHELITQIEDHNFSETSNNNISQILNILSWRNCEFQKLH